MTIMLQLHFLNRCSVFGWIETFPGNKTHDSECSPPGKNLPHLNAENVLKMNACVLIFPRHQYQSYDPRRRHCAVVFGPSRVDDMQI